MLKQLLRAIQFCSIILIVFTFLACGSSSSSSGGGSDISGNCAAIAFSAGSGTASDPYQISNLCQLQNIGANNTNLSRHYKLISNIDASWTRGWNIASDGTAEGFAPLGSSLLINSFVGSFNGNDYTIANLYINRPLTRGVGLFGFVGSIGRGATIANARLTNISVHGEDWVGGLVGYNFRGSITGSYASGSVRGGDEVGGLVGFNDLGSITGSYASGSVSGDDWVGGLVGYDSGSITGSYASGSVRGGDEVGGLVGYKQEGSITGSYATGSVQGDDRVGGLVGYNYGSISASYASGSVHGNLYVGGLVGGNGGSITGSYASGSVHGEDYVGGLVGRNDGSISASYASGSVHGEDYVGGLVGYNNEGSISASYASGSVHGDSYVGGLVGYNYSGSITGSYASGSVHGVSSVGGLVGDNRAGSISASYWNRETSGHSTSDGGSGVTSARFLQTSNLFNASDGTWDYLDSRSYPILVQNIANTSAQSLHIAAGMLRLANATGDDFLGAENLQHDFTIDVSSVPLGSTFTWLDVNAAASNNSSRVDYFDCNNNSASNILLTTQSVGNTSITLQFSNETSDNSAWEKAAGTSCAIRRSSSGLVQVGNKLVLEAVISKGSGAEKRSYTKTFKITFE